MGKLVYIDSGEAAGTGHGYLTPGTAYAARRQQTAGTAPAETAAAPAETVKAKAGRGSSVERISAGAAPAGAVTVPAETVKAKAGKGGSLVRIPAPADAGSAAFDAAYTRLENEARQAAVDLDIDTMNQANRQMKEMRAAAGRQTKGDRVDDILSSALNGWSASFVNTYGTTQAAAGAARRRYLPLDIEQAERELARYLHNAEYAADSAERQYWALEADRARGSLEGLRSGLEESWDQGKPALALADRMRDDSEAFLASAKAGLGTVGQLAADTGVAGTQMGMDALTAAFTGGSAAVPMAVRAFGDSAQEARRGGASLGRQLAYGGGSTALALGTNKLSNLVKPVKWLRGQDAAEGITEGLARYYGVEGAWNALKNFSGNTGGQILTTALDEGTGGVAYDVMLPILKQVTYDPEAEFDSGEVRDNFLVRSILGGVGKTADVLRETAQKKVPPALQETYLQEVLRGDAGNQESVRTSEMKMYNDSMNLKEFYRRMVNNQNAWD